MSYPCKLCWKKFACRRQWKLHARTHVRAKPFSCEVCLKKFANGRDLTTHMRIHIGEKLFSCGLCWKMFNTKCGLANHAYFHQGENYFCTSTWLIKSGRFSAPFRYGNNYRGRLLFFVYLFGLFVLVCLFVHRISTTYDVVFCP